MATTQKNDIVKVGDTVMWSAGFSLFTDEAAVVVSLELTESPRTKTGRDVQEVSWDMVRANRVLFGLSNGSWAYSEQITKIE